MKPEFTVAWVLLVLYILAVEFGAVFLGPDLDYFRLGAAVYFVVVEAWALGRRRSGDTLSEHVWAFYNGKRARISLVLGFVAYVFAAAIAIPAEVEPTVAGLPAAPLALSLGVVGWLVPHFLFRGRYG